MYSSVHFITLLCNVVICTSAARQMRENTPLKCEKTLHSNATVYSTALKLLKPRHIYRVNRVTLIGDFLKKNKIIFPRAPPYGRKDTFYV